MRKCIRTAAALLLTLALAAGLFGCSKLAPIVSGGDKPHTTEPAATGSQTDTEDTQNMENAEDTGEQDLAGEEESSDPAPVETDPPVWEGPETVVYLAPYDALAVEYGGYFYYVDRDDNLCRTTTDMTDYTLFCEAQIRGDVRIIGITDAGRMYLSSGGQSCYVDLAEGRDGMAADYGMVESQTFTGAALSIGIRALRGGWMYYTKSGENGLFRAKIGAVPEEENCIVFDKDIREAAVTGDYLIYTYNRGSRADLQVTLADDPDSLLLTIEGNGTYPTTMLAGTDDRSGTPDVRFGLQASRPGSDRGWKLEAAKNRRGDPPARFVQVINGATRPKRGSCASSQHFSGIIAQSGIIFLTSLLRNRNFFRQISRMLLQQAQILSIIRPVIFRGVRPAIPTNER